MTRLLSLIALTASVLPLAVATSNASCKPGSQFDFLGFCIDLDINGNADCKGTAPPSKSCPDSWFWNTKANHCTPQSPGASSSTPCGDGEWNAKELCCTKPSGPTTTKVAVTTSKAAPTSAAPPAATSSASGCADNEFSWLGLKGQCCLPHGGQPNPPSPPAGSSCPSTWYWHQDQGCCVPTKPSSPEPSCPSGHSWLNQCCKPTGGASTTPAATSPVKTPGTGTTTSPASSSTGTCGSNEFSWLGLKGECCLPHGGKPNPPSPPAGSSCPSTWWWHSGQGCCVPSKPSPPQPSCPSGHSWSSWWCTPNGGTPTTSSKPPSSTGTCGDNEFSWWGLKGQCCLPHGGKPNPPSPPSGSSCPPTWWWHHDQGCCVPTLPSPPTPTCPSGNSWKDQCCKPSGPQPSGHYVKRHKKKRTATLCPAGLDACAVKNAFGLSSDYECVDTAQDVQSCGGCSSVNSDFDCTAIEGSWNVGCEKGACRVYSCQAGYKLTAKNTCEQL
ncbi:hypothetical protein PENSPDRAFT_679253 [Peniophora sp. CONT]|nr:hypothetical protein PENSPDRAFT_679253 [Peniophora sp. CONT]